MKKSKRYDTSHLIEDQSEPGSRGRVLKNKLGITSKREMDRCEKAEQMRTIEELTNIFGVDHRFTASDIGKIHRLWLGNIYEWAGERRTILKHFMRVWRETISRSKRYLRLLFVRR